MPLIQIDDLCFTHEDGRVIFNHVSLRLDSTWKLGLIGRNGRGKTTLLKILHGDYPCGKAVHAPMRMDYFPCTVEDSGLQGQALLSRLCPEAMPWQWEREASLLALPPETLKQPFHTLSGGEAVKLLLAGLFLREGAFPLLDEPTDHLDMTGRQVLAKYLRGKSGFILVSHDRALLDGCVDHTLSINRADVELQRGNFSSWQRNRELQDQYEADENQRLQAEIGRLQESARRSATWSHQAEKEKFGHGVKRKDFIDRGFIGHKAAKVMQKAKNVEKRRNEAVEEKIKLLRNVELNAPLTMNPQEFHSKRIAELHNVSVGYGNKTVLGNFSLALLRGERLALRGPNGCGKSTLLKLLAGQLQPGLGKVFLPPSLRVSVVPQDCSHVQGSLKHFATQQNVEEPLLRAVLHRLGFERNQLDTLMQNMSTGQKKKVILATSLCTEAHLFIWDEPLNYIDIISRMRIEETILAYQPTMVFVEHDQAFSQRVATRVIDFTAQA